jgi:hypothetical protein
MESICPRPCILYDWMCSFSETNRSTKMNSTNFVSAVFGYYKTCRIISTPPKFVKCQPPPWNIVTLLMDGWGNTRTSEGKKVGESWESKIALESKWIKWWRSLDAWGELKKANGFIEEKRGWKWEGKGGDGGEREGVGGFSTELAQGATAPWN